MPRQSWLLDILADEFRGSKGFRVDYYPGWATRGSSVFTPNHVMDHHTGRGAYNSLLNYMAVGPVHPPLCNTAVSRPHNGVVRITVIAAGRANHAGRGRYKTIPSNEGNKYALGRENQNTGNQSWPQQQIEAIRRCDAAELQYLRKSTDYLLDHKTYAPYRKSDRVGINIHNERMIVTELMRSSKNDWDAFMSTLDKNQKQSLTKLANLNDKELDVVISLARYLKEKEVEGHSFGRQTLKLIREYGGPLRELIDEINDMNTSPRGLARFGTVMTRMFYAMGYPINNEMAEKVRENKIYSKEELGL